MKVLTNELPLQLTSHSSTLALLINVGQTLTECTKRLHFQITVITIRNHNANDCKIKMQMVQMMQDVMMSIKVEKYLNYTQSHRQIIGRVKNMLTLHGGKRKLTRTII